MYVEAGLVGAAGHGAAFCREGPRPFDRFRSLGSACGVRGALQGRRDALTWMRAAPPCRDPRLRSLCTIIIIMPGVVTERRARVLCRDDARPFFSFFLLFSACRGPSGRPAGELSGSRPRRLDVWRGWGRRGPCLPGTAGARRRKAVWRRRRPASASFHVSLKQAGTAQPRPSPAATTSSPTTRRPLSRIRMRPCCVCVCVGACVRVCVCVEGAWSTRRVPGRYSPLQLQSGRSSYPLDTS